MIVESIQRTFSINPLYTEQVMIRTLVDPKNQKEYRESVTYRIYTRLGQIEESYQQKIDLRA